MIFSFMDSQKQGPTNQNSAASCQLGNTNAKTNISKF
jgi:hypothetical protein